MHQNLPTVGDCRLIALPHHDDPRGCLTVLERSSEIPFDVRRAIVIANVPAGATRGRQANRTTSELLLCGAGAVTVRIEDGRSVRAITLSSRSGALLVPPMLWIELRDFAPGTVLLVFADTSFRDAEGSYLRDREAWLASRSSRVA
jgi:WxcM-like, C-terminal